MFSIITITTALAVSGFSFYFIRKRMKSRKKLSDEFSGKKSESKCRRIKGKPSLEHLDQIATRMDQVLTKKKIFTNPDLTIQDLASEVGTNRTYVSSTINKFYNKNFTTFINGYRFIELSQMVRDKSFHTHKELAIRSGFGSVDSMKRVIKVNTGLSLRHWKEKLLSESKEEEVNQSI